jgi:transcriptional regulator with PAS, ATPase and Fis domain
MLEFRVFLNKKLIQKAVLSKGKINIGRSVDSDLVLRHEHVSRLHVVIEQEGDVFRLEDKSTNGVLLDGQRITESTHLPPRCRLEIYPFEIECLRLQEDRTAPISKTDIKAPPFEMPLGGTPSLPSALSYHYGILVGESLPMQQVYQLIEDVSNSPVTVLIRGEHGTGKELVARAIHESSPRKDRPFIALNCAAIPLELIESELFGYEKGTFTGAQTLKKGKIEEAHGGTLFLDEVGELSPQAQAKFLRFLQEKAFMRLGSAQEISVDVRILSATNKDLERAIREETFRADLYYRIKVVQVSLPPLRDRLEDIPLLAAHILERLTRELQLSSIPTVTPQAMNRLQTAQWPGNIRQMENVLYSAVIRSRPPYVIDEQTLLSDSPTWIGRQEAPKETPLDSITRQLLLQTLNQTRWDTAKAADILKVSRATVYYKLKKYGIDPREASKGGSKL